MYNCCVQHATKKNHVYTTRQLVCTTTATFEMVSQKLHGDFDLTSWNLSINVGF